MKEIKTQVINGVTWTTEFPKEEGDYWFYGYRYGKKSCGHDCKPEWMTLKARKCANGLLFSANGQFMYKNELEESWFTKLILPEFPKLLP
jgi:hypothetical protein